VTTETSGRRPPTHYKPPLVSWEEYLPWALANEFPSEWVDGRVVDVVTQNLRSNLIVQFLQEKISHHVRSSTRGLVIFNFLMWLPDRPSGRVPDLMFIAEEHQDRVRDTYLDGPADLAVEVVSLDSLVRDQRDKFLEYAAAGVREYWLIDEYHETARFYLLGADGQYFEAALADNGAYTSTVLPGLRLPIKRLWHEPFASFREDLAGRAPDPTLPVRRSSPADMVSPCGHRATRSAPETMNTNGPRASTSYAPPLVSWEDFHDWALGIEGRAEWVDGEITELVGDNIRHYLLVHFLANLLSRHVDLHDLGRVFIETIVMRISSRPGGRMPDVFFVANEHRGRIKDTFVDGPADMVIEVVSPDSEVRDRFIKLAEYQDAGIPEYWLVDQPRHEAHFYVLGEDGKYHEVSISANGVYTSTVLPGLRLRVDWLWRDPLPTPDEALADLRE
jgi:Uma2 family endonuclease